MKNMRNRYTIALMTMLQLTAIIPVMEAQVNSSCQGADSVVNKYRNDSRRLAVRRVFKTGSSYKDSVAIDTSQSGRYMRALIAVYNATAIPARDTVVSLLNIHTNPDPELRSLHIKAPGTLAWMNKLMNSITPTGDAQVDQLMSKYKLQPMAYYQSINYDLAVLKSDSSLNIAALCTAFKGISGVMDSAPETSYNDTRNIKDSTGTGFTILNYSYGWGTCENGCDYRAFWKLKVYGDCSVEWLGSSGDVLYTAINDLSKDAGLARFYPNPADAIIYLEKDVAGDQSDVEISDLTGRLILRDIPGVSGEIDISGLPAGVYIARVKKGDGVWMGRIVKR
jgi:hypothetical protein